jgi:hypothetical protein
MYKKISDISFDFSKGGESVNMEEDGESKGYADEELAMTMSFLP